MLFNPKLGNKAVHAFHKSIYLKVNEIARQEFELAFYNLAVWHVKPLRYRLSPVNKGWYLEEPN